MSYCVHVGFILIMHAWHPGVLWKVAGIVSSCSEHHAIRGRLSQLPVHHSHYESILHEVYFDIFAKGKAKSIIICPLLNSIWRNLLEVMPPGVNTTDSSSAIGIFVWTPHTTRSPELTLWGRAILEKTIASQPSRNIPRFIEHEVQYSVDTSPPLMAILSQMNLIQLFQPIYLRSIIIISCRLRLGLSSCIFPLRFPTNINLIIIINFCNYVCPFPIKFLFANTFFLHSTK